MKRSALLLLAIGLVNCSDDSSNPNGEIDAGGGGGTCAEGVDKSVDWASAVALPAGQDTQGTVCPAKDKDFFKVTVPDGMRLLHIKLQYSVALTNVDLTYMIARVPTGQAKEEIVAKAPPWTGSGIRIYDDFYCLDPGAYYIVVYDDGDDEKDGSNRYTLSYTVDKDNDANEPGNDTMGPSAPAPGTGSISCNGDVDFFKVAVGADQLLEVTLSTAAATKVDMKYTIYDEAKTKVGDASNHDGSKGPTALTAIHAVPKAGTYYIAVEDEGSDDSDPKTTYTLAAATKAEEDPGDKGTRNDRPATATVLDYSSCQGAGCTRTGQIASKADMDYFRLEGLPGGLSPDNLAVIDVTVDFSGSSKVDPQVSLIYPHAGTSCTKDSCCRVLNQACTSYLDCVRETYSCIKKEDIFCSDTDCAPKATTSCVTEQACAGAVVCLPGGVCGAEQVTRYDDKGEDGAVIRTAQPLIHPGPWFIRVNDFQSDDYEYGKTYTLTVKVRMDPDNPRELNSEYFPLLVQSGTGTTEYHVKAAKAKGDAVRIKPGDTISGFISYEGDQDWYLFDHPCPGKDCTYKISYHTTGSNCPSGLEFVYTLNEEDGAGWFAFPAKPASGQSGSFGPPENCLYAFSRHTGNPYTYLFSVTDLNHNSWSWDCGYSFSISQVSNGCNAPCKMNDTNSGPQCSSN
jgi:hypothetical protein